MCFKYSRVRLRTKSRGTYRRSPPPVRPPLLEKEGNVFQNQKPSQNNKKPKKQGATRESAVTILTPGCHFNGKLYCRGSSRIGGRIEGEIVSEGLLIIEEEAEIAAEITAEEAIIQGKVEGKLTADGRVELCATSQFNGDIQSPLLAVREGAQFNGRSTMVQGQQADKVKADKTPEPKLDTEDKKMTDGDIDPNMEQPDVAVLKVSESSAPGKG